MKISLIAFLLLLTVFQKELPAQESPSSKRLEQEVIAASSKLLGLNSKNKIPLDIFNGPVVDSVIAVDGIPFLTSTNLKPEDRWEIINGKPELDKILAAKTAEEFADALFIKGSLLAVGWASKELLLESINQAPNSPYQVKVRRLYIDKDYLYTVFMETVVRKNASTGLGPPQVLIPTLNLQRYDRDVIKRVSE